jgi:2-iminobutanoate/2-iminopropanoate deaminase
VAIRIVQTDRAPAAIGPYSQGTVAAGWLFVSGQLGIQPETGEFAGSDFGTQAHRALQNLKEVLLAGGCELKDVTEVDVFLADMGKFTQFNQIYAEYFSEHRPARAVVEVSALPKGAQVEIKCVAFRGSV